MKRLLAALVACLSFVAIPATAQAIYGEAGAPLVAEVLGTAIHTDDPEEMQYVIVRKLLDQYAAENGIEVQPEEIDAYIDAIARATARDRLRREARRAEIAGRLESGALADDERQRLSAELNVLNDLLESPGAPVSDAEAREERAAREQIAAAFIRQWKINRALYDQFGGRIINQQGGPEPLDAYRQFLTEQARQGAFRILDKSLEPGFWRYFVTDSIHSFYPSGSPEEAQAFATPWWLSKSAPGVE